MLKVFLAEDEYIVREGIKNNVDWKSHGYEFCGEASDGEQAYPMIQKLRPDIVITDIKMPFMDGLALSKLIKKNLPETEIILLSGYAEFAYAKEAISIGVAQYISKPISASELLKEVDSLAVKIEKNRRERDFRMKYEREMEENLQSERKRLFEYLVTGTKSVPELLEMAEKQELDISALWYNIVLLKMQSMYHTQEEYSGSYVRAEKKLKDLLQAKGVIFFDRNPEGCALLFSAETKEELLQLQNDFLKQTEESLKEYERIRYFGGIGMPVNRLGDLSLSFEKASHAFAHRYLMKESRILDFADAGAFYIKDEFNIRKVDTKHMDRSRIQEFLKFGDSREAVYFVEEFFKGLGIGAMKSTIFRQYIAMDTFFCVTEFVESLHQPKEEIESLDVASEIIRSAEGTQRYVVRILTRALELRDSAASNRYGDIVTEVMRYIEKNYAKEELSLNLLASHVNFSPNHLSVIFSQQTGQTFIKYLTDFRMNKAKELLRCTGKRSNVIGMEVGYRDPHYFSFLFKKTQGVTPTQYREGKTPEEMTE